MTHQFTSTLDVKTTRGNMIIDWEDDITVEYTHTGASVELSQVFNSRREEILDSLRDRDRARLIGEAWEDVVRRDEIDATLLDRVLDDAADSDADRAREELVMNAMEEACNSEE